MSCVALCFWGSILLLGYAHLGYPLLIWAWSRLRPRPARGGRIEPRVTVLVVTHNEAARIGQRLANLLALEYPADRLQILLASDGSTDGTAEYAVRHARGRVEIVHYPGRRGKTAVLNAMLPRASGEIVILGDTRQRFAPDAIRTLVAPFADPTVGAASGELVLLGGDRSEAVGTGLGFYWRYEKLIRRSEGLVDSTIGVTGAIYAIRRDLVEPIPDDTILDDVVIPMRVVRRGYRVLFEPAARAYDRVSPTAVEEFRRKVRTIAGTFQLFARERWILNPFGNRVWLQTVSHKGLRLLGPLLLGGALVANLALADEALYRATLVAQIAFYLAALGGWARRNGRWTHLALAAPYVFCLLNWATVVAFARFVSGRQRVTWDVGSFRSAGTSTGASAAVKDASDAPA
jgi:cellulose synthase/poly-beta-1,6-N-acetylglucosamine synthase-like glycosyltransferase